MMWAYYTLKGGGMGKNIDPPTLLPPSSPNPSLFIQINPSPLPNKKVTPLVWN